MEDANPARSAQLGRDYERQVVSQVILFKEHITKEENKLQKHSQAMSKSTNMGRNAPIFLSVMLQHPLDL